MGMAWRRRRRRKESKGGGEGACSQGPHRDSHAPARSLSLSPDIDAIRPSNPSRLLANIFRSRPLLVAVSLLVLISHPVGAEPCLDLLPAPSNDNTSLCVCSAGFGAVVGANETFCEACKQGKYRLVSGPGECADCPPHSWSAGGNSSCECNAGSEPEAARTTCLLCPAGKYKELPGNGSCTRCSLSSYSKQEGATSCISCPSRTGSWLDGSACVCSPGFFGVSSCFRCFPGKFSSEPASTSCSACPSGKFSTGSASACTACDPGTFSTGDTDRCLLCAAGKYTETNGTQECFDCPAGTYSEVVGSATATLCLACSPGTFSMSGSTFCSQCRPGTFAANVQTSSCQACDYGTYLPTEGANSSGACKVCSDMLATSPRGSENSSYCVCIEGHTLVDGVCSPCPPGTYKDFNGTEACLLCPYAKYSNQSGLSSAQSCQACPYGSVCEEGSTVVEQCRCDRGYEYINGTCWACALGYHKSEVNNSLCTRCEAGKYGPQEAMQDCLLCPNHTFSGVVGSSNVSDCHPCPSNSSSNMGNRELSGCICNENNFLREGVCVSCRDCDYRNSIHKDNGRGRGPCLPCPYGNQDKLAGQGPMPMAECKGILGGYQFEYGWIDNDVRISWGKDLHVLAHVDNGTEFYLNFPYQEAVVPDGRMDECAANCSEGWRWLSAQDWYAACLQWFPPARCSASAFPRVRVRALAGGDFEQEGELYKSGDLLGGREDGYSFGGCWPCTALTCPPGFQGVNICPSMRTGGESREDLSTCSPCPAGTAKLSYGSSMCLPSL
uniref:Tyrosine-protein kinase ephrin type A/B receptor-like domain-containing protein n=1 Tax=Hanusia phi TaxID=3032 RepID=A0A7S0E2M3_9CRYP|mmetsp:Transcript_14820/g.34052  ORF Transcript_14820/g.34052 Transcript_14820/m.34052 type:complete len:782 (+) Transcript_14820:24-2369(+)